MWGREVAAQKGVARPALGEQRGEEAVRSSRVMARLQSGALVTLHACGEAISSCAFDVRVFCAKAILRTGIWGEQMGKKLTIGRHSRKRFRVGDVPPSRGVREQCLAARSREKPDPSPPEVGLRTARLWDAIQASAAEDSAPVKLVSRSA